MKQQCGWVEDQFGLSWQIIPATPGNIMQGNPMAVMDALLKMKKIDIGKLQEASRMLKGAAAVLELMGAGAARHDVARMMHFRRERNNDASDGAGKGDKESEAGLLPSTDLLEAMGRFNQELIDAGIMLAGEGLRPSSEGVRVIFDGEARTVQDGPLRPPANWSPVSGSGK